MSGNLLRVISSPLRWLVLREEKRFRKHPWSQALSALGLLAALVIAGPFYRFPGDLPYLVPAAMVLGLFLVEVAAYVRSHRSREDAGPDPQA